MYLKSLTLRGFKSFASATTLEFEPGITCVVGPNGSGKSNVVDAIAWVMGEQGAKALRGGKMDDVIFAGTSGRAPLGRAQVSLCIDNNDGALPIDYTEVTITRTMFRSGGSEYAINGTHCRLLDVQELLADSGIGREQHVIVGQGQLDSILHANAEDRRGFIEEAAGVLKHRKRKEKALRKLDSMSANLTRLTDLTTELRRQLKPLGRQADVARRAQVIQSDVRDARLRLLADDLLILSTTLRREESDEAELRERRSTLESEIAVSRARESELELASVQQATTTQQINELHLRLTTLRERFRGLINLATERATYLDDVGDERQGTDPDVLEEQADLAQAEHDKLAIEVEARVAALAQALDSSRAADQTLATATGEEERRQAESARRRESRARLEGDVQAATSRRDARLAETQRLTVALAEVQQRRGPLQRELAGLTAGGPRSDTALTSLAADRKAASGQLGAAKAELARARDGLAQAERDSASVGARIEALQLSVTRDSNLETFTDSGVSLLGVVGESIRVDSGWEAAVESALCTKAHVDAFAVADIGSAAAALRHLRAGRAGRATLLIAGGENPGCEPVQLTPGATRATAVMRATSQASEAVFGAIRELLRDVVLTADLDQAQDQLRLTPAALVVTREGDVISSTVAFGGDGAASRLELTTAIELARSHQREVEALRAQLVVDVQRCDALCGERRAAAKGASDAFDHASRQASAYNSKVALLESRVGGIDGEIDRVTQSLAKAHAAQTGDAEAVQSAISALTEHDCLAATERSVQPDVDLAAMRAQLVELRRIEVEARLGVRTIEERMSAHERRVKELRVTAAAEREARIKAQRARQRRIAQATVAQEVLAVAKDASHRLESALAESDRRRLGAEQAASARSSELSQLRAGIRQLAQKIAELTSSVHRDEIARAEQRLRVEQLETKALEEFGLPREELVAEYGPQGLVPPSATAPGDEIDPQAPKPQPYPFVRVEQEKRLRTAEKSMALLGRVNPLALEEFSAMEERHTFLTTQLDDLKKSRKDLLDLIAEVDGRVQEVFAQAFADVEREFESVFSVLFPGGEGRLVLTDPSNMLTTGIEVEARPAGKKVKRLSLLSGGERSLTAVAFLLALFKARPSPFYLLDEVEAALDDVNLGRLLVCLAELRENSQLLIITHQKRTMEIADTLYGITMREGVTQVISQRLHELQPA